MRYTSVVEQVLTLSSIRDQREERQRAIDLARAQIVENEAALRELEVAERFVKRFGVILQTAHASAEEMPPPAPKPLRMIPLRAQQRDYYPVRQDGEPKNSPTEGIMITVLRHAKDIWSTANEIQEWASTLKGSDIPMSTISPLLTKLKNDGVIVREGLKVALAERLNEIGTPTAERRESHTVQEGSTVGSEDADGKEAEDA